MTIASIQLFLTLSQQSIRADALHTQGAECWTVWTGCPQLETTKCTAFGQKSNDLVTALARVARRISTTFIDPSSLLGYIHILPPCPLDKSPGVHPIGIGVVVQRIIGLFGTSSHPYIPLHFEE